MGFWAAWIPHTAPVSVKERARSALGALLGILLTGLVCKAAVGTGTTLPVLIAPMGASAVLLFAVPASPLAQPWSILGGNLVAALVGVGTAALVPDPFVAAALGVAVTVALMMSCRCVHPPSGAVALTAVLGGKPIHDLGFGFVLWPVGVNSLALLAVALAFNGLAGRRYPHRPAPEPPALPSGAAEADRLLFSGEDLDAALRDFDQVLDVDRDDLETLFRQTELRAWRRRAGGTTCASIVVRNVTALAPDAPLRDALDLLRTQRVKALPVTDESARVCGLVTQTDLLDKAAWGDRGPRLTPAHRWRVSLLRGRAPNGSVEDIMTAPVDTVRLDTPLAVVVEAMARSNLSHLPVVDDEGRLAGMVAQSDLVVALLAEAAAAGLDEGAGR